ncbi:MAG TPA: hypothetical protein VGH34_21305 [Vicinamibacterales bacterium]|jgi:hypothetical protein
MTRALTVAALTLTATSLGACAHVAASSKGLVTPDARRAAIQRAQVWSATDVPSMDLRTGPTGRGAFAPDAPVTCTYIEKKMSGNTPKFTCVIPPDDEVKVKYGRHNAEVYAEVAASRLFWALGFGAEHMYPVSVTCNGCPATVHPEDALVASIQRKMPGRELQTSKTSGWAWPELDEVQTDAGGAPAAQRDALKLLATFVQHTDSKADQQRLICLPADGDRKPSAESECAHPFMLTHDLGETFGHANSLNRASVGGVNLKEWSRAPVWKDPAHCVAYLPKSLTGTLENPRISEDGRKFLADLLVQLTDAQLHDLFDVSRFQNRWDVTSHPEEAASVDQWVAAFKAKRDEVVNHQCDSDR